VDSLEIVKSLHEVDPGFVELCKTLFGDTVHPEDVWEYLYTPDGVSKMSPGASDVHVNNAGKGKLVPRERTPQIPNVRVPKKINPKMKDGTIIDNTDAMSKSDDDFDITWAGEFDKADEDKRQVFGWASIVEVDGQPVVDRQGDWISPDEIEKAAYQYVLNSRKAGHQHKRDGDQPFHAGDMIESFVMTPEKIEKMGLPDSTPVGWWVGYKIHDDEAWSKVKKGEVTGFSIHGRGKRKEAHA
jgi:hypothetical protein